MVSQAHLLGSSVGGQLEMDMGTERSRIAEAKQPFAEKLVTKERRLRGTETGCAVRSGGAEKVT